MSVSDAVVASLIALFFVFLFGGMFYSDIRQREARIECVQEMSGREASEIVTVCGDIK